MAEDQQDTPNEGDEVQRIRDDQKSQEGSQKQQRGKDSYSINETRQIQDGQGTQRDRRRVYGGYSRPKCNSRLEELSKPRRWYMLSTWKEHGEIFDSDRMLAFKEKIQEEFSMSPEETELYFAHLRRQVRKSQRKAALARQLKREKAAAKLQAYQIFKLLLQRAMEYAFRHPAPPIVSPMIRRMSDTILEQLCEIHGTELPNRDSRDKFSVFLVSLADWTAIVVGNIYYEIDVNDKIDIERMKELEQMSRTTVSKEETKEDIKKEKRTSLLRKHKQHESKELGVMGEEEDAILYSISSHDVYHLALTDEDITEDTTGEDTDTEGAVKNEFLGEG